MRAGLIQLCSGDQPTENLAQTKTLIANAANDGATFILTPEVTNLVTLNRDDQRAVIQPEPEDITLAALREQAAALQIWLLIGSLALSGETSDDRFVNRSFLIAPDGRIHARYDKIHMFDVDVSPDNRFRESDAYRPGDQPVVADIGMGLGMTICYDLRFGHLYRDLALAGAQVMAVPAAMLPETGAAHIETLLRARAIENGAYVLMPAQTGQHPAQNGRSRHSWGHSMAVDPWGKVIAKLGTEPGFICLDLDQAAVQDARNRIPTLAQTRDYKKPINV